MTHASPNRNTTDANHSVERLARALQDDAFVLCCQPILALAGPERYPMGEVLVRMHEEERALLPPGEFLPLFEHHGMMPQLDRWIVLQVIALLAQGSRWRRLSVNLSRQTLDDVAFPAFVANALMQEGVSAASVLFEIEENDALALPAAALRFTRAMKSIGSDVLIDGFGGTSASLTVLRSLKAGFVKLDGSLVRRLLSDDTAHKQTQIILRLAKTLGFSVIAANVEDQDVLAHLKALGVGYAQGFGIQGTVRLTLKGVSRDESGRDGKGSESPCPPTDFSHADPRYSPKMQKAQP